MGFPDNAGCDVMTALTKLRQQRGTTLIEQIMVLAIIAVLTSVAIPNLRTMLTRNQVQVAQTDFMASLQNARANAAYTGVRTLVCPSPDGVSCRDDNQWGQGWLLGPDTDHDDQPDNGPLHVGRGYHDKVSIRSSSGRHIVRFHPDGSAGGSNLTVVFCDRTGETPALTVVVSNSGRIRGAPGTAKQTASCHQPDE